MIQDMGLGKTLTTLALIMSSTEHLPFEHKRESEFSRTKTTLIVAPFSRK